MNKLELISALKTKADISKSEAAKVVQIFFDSMAVRLDGPAAEGKNLVIKHAENNYYGYRQCNT